MAVPSLVDSFSNKELSKNLIATCESVRNSYTPTSNVKRNKLGQRIDYILYHPGSKAQVWLKSYCQPLPDRVPQYPYSYSDHEAIESTLVISKRTNLSTSVSGDEKTSVLEDCIAILTKSLKKLEVHKMVYFLFATILFALLLLSFVFDSPFGFTIIFHFLRMLVLILVVFCLIMGIIWNPIEKHGILAGKLAMEVSINQLSR